MRGLTALALAAAFSLTPLLSAEALSINPAAFDRVLTEGKRTQTVDGVDVSGAAAVLGNGDVVDFDMGALGAGDDVLLVGRVVADGADAYSATSVTGEITVTVLNYAESSRDGESPFRALFKLVVGGVLAETIDLTGSDPDILGPVGFASIFALDQEVALIVEAIDGVSDYDIGISISDGQRQQLTTTPLPGGLPLLFGGLAVIGMAACRKRRRAG